MKQEVVKELNQNRISENKMKFSDLYTKGSGYTVTSNWTEPDVQLTQVGQYENAALDFEVKVKQYNIQAKAVEEGFDNVPAVGFFPDIAYLMTLGYECPMQYQGDLVISMHKYANAKEAEVYEYVPDVYNRGLYSVALERIDKFQEMYPQIPITVSDIQSPIDIITEFLPADKAILMLYDDPELAHRILDGITQSIIDVNRKYENSIKNFGGFKSGAYLPFGIHVSDDNAAFLSPEIYENFAVPYTNKLSEAFGGISFHVCMKFEQNLKKLSSTKGFIGYDAMPYYNDPALILEAIGGGKVWNLYDYDFTRPANENEAPIDFYKRLIDINEGRNGLRIDTYHENKDQALKLAYEVKNYAEKRVN